MLVELLKTILMLLIIIDPLGNLPIFLGLTVGKSKKERKKIFHKAVFVGCIILISFAILGKIIVDIFKIKIGNFAIAGGLLLLLLGVDIIKGKEKQYESASLAIVPMATPMLAGPGAITAIILSLHSNGYVLTISAVFVVIALIKIFFWKADEVYKLLGKNGSLVIARLMGVVLAALGVNFIMKGLDMLGILK